MKKVIFISGMGWSGSSLLVDVLYDHRVVIGISGTYPDETMLLSKKQSPISFMNKFSYSKKIDAFGIVALITGGRYGLNESIFSHEIRAFFYHVMGNFSVGNSNNFMNIEYDKLLMIVRNAMNSEEYVSLERFKIVYKKISEELVNYQNKKFQKLVLFNNDPNFVDLMFFDIPNYSDVYIVFRNPCDSLCENRFIPKSKFKRLVFILKNSLLLRSQYKMLLSLSFNNNYNIIDFDDLASNKLGLIEKILSKYTVIEEKISHDKHPHYDLSISVSNIGKYTSNLSFTEILIINVLLRKYYKKIKTRLVNY